MMVYIIKGVSSLTDLPGLRRRHGVQGTPNPTTETGIETEKQEGTIGMLGAKMIKDDLVLESDAALVQETGTVHGLVSASATETETKTDGIEDAGQLHHPVLVQTTQRNLRN
jgi:hypothetical protein